LGNCKQKTSKALWTGKDVSRGKARKLRGRKRSRKTGQRISRFRRMKQKIKCFGKMLDT